MLQREIEMRGRAEGEGKRENVKELWDKYKHV
jgi:hypothetical protein